MMMVRSSLEVESDTNHILLRRVRCRGMAVVLRRNVRKMYQWTNLPPCRRRVCLACWLVWFSTLLGRDWLSRWCDIYERAHEAEHTLVRSLHNKMDKFIADFYSYFDGTTAHCSVFSVHMRRNRKQIDCTFDIYFGRLFLVKWFFSGAKMNCVDAHSAANCLRSGDRIAHQAKFKMFSYGNCPS